MLFTRTPNGANSSAAVRASPRAANLEAPYADNKGAPGQRKH